VKVLAKPIDELFPLVLFILNALLLPILVSCFIYLALICNRKNKSQQCHEIRQSERNQNNAIQREGKSQIETVFGSLTPKQPNPVVFTFESEVPMNVSSKGSSIRDTSKTILKNSIKPSVGNTSETVSQNSPMYKDTNISSPNDPSRELTNNSIKASKNDPTKVSTAGTSKMSKNTNSKTPMIATVENESYSIISSVNQLTKKDDKPVNEPVTNPVSEPVSNPVSEPVTNPVTNPVSNPVCNPVSDNVYNPVSNPVSKPDLLETGTTNNDDHTLFEDDNDEESSIRVISNVIVVSEIKVQPRPSVV
jgi:hypothetical protein